MSKILRRVIFYTFALAFIAATPLLLAYSWGYVFNPFTKSVKKTGGIFIKSRMPQLFISLNNAYAKRTSLISGGAVLTGIEPGTYLLKIEKEGYQPWLKGIEVEAEMVTELRNILLVPQDMTPATTSPEDLPERPETFPLPPALTNADIHSFDVVSGKIIFVNKKGFLGRFDPDTQEVETLAYPGFYLDDTQVKFAGSPSGDLIIIDAAGGAFWLDTANNISILANNVADASFDAKGEKLLLQKEASLEIIWFRDNSYQPFQKKSERETVLILSTPLRETAWFYRDNMHIVFSTDEGVYWTEVDGRGGRNTAELVSQRIDELLTTTEVADTVFYRQGKSWYQIKL